MTNYCAAPNCEKIGAENGVRRLCRKHQWRLNTHGSFDLPPRQGPSVEERFWAKVNKDAPNGCWEWTASRTVHGYGQFAYKGGLVKASRYIFIRQGLELPAGIFVCHHCDNPPCVNPEHLFLGTAQDNADDMVAKERHRGRSRAILTVEQVQEARARVAQGETQSSVARSLGVASTTINSAVTGGNWSWI